MAFRKVTAPSDLRILSRDDAAANALWRNVFMTLWWGDVNVERLRSVGALQQRIASELPTGFVSLTLLRSNNLSLPAEVRAEAERVTAGMPAAMRAVAQVIHGTGFTAAATRSVATGMQLFVRDRRPVKFFDTVENASAWLAPHQGSLPSSRAAAPSDIVHAARSVMREVVPVSAGPDAAPW